MILLKHIWKKNWYLGKERLNIFNSILLNPISFDDIFNLLKQGMYRKSFFYFSERLIYLLVKNNNSPFLISKKTTFLEVKVFIIFAYENWANESLFHL